MVEAKKLVFMGTPDFAAIILEKIIRQDRFNITGVFTQPDRKSGRGLKTEFQSVKNLALAHELPLFQPPTLRTDEAWGTMVSLKPDFIIVASYGMILPQKLLDVASIAPINVHASLLPRYRGAAPIQWALMENWGPYAETGVSIMKMTAELDAGPVYARKAFPIGHRTYGEMQNVLAYGGADLLEDVLEKMLAGEHIVPMPQDESLATYAPKLDKKAGIINWNMPADQVDAHIRAVTPWPGAQANLQFSGLKNAVRAQIILGEAVPALCPASSGEIFYDHRRLFIACSQDWYQLVRLRPEGRKEMAAHEFANGCCRKAQGLCGMAI